MESRLAGKISEGVDRGTWVHWSMLDLGALGTQTENVVGPDVVSVGVQADKVVSPSYADVARRGGPDVDTVMGVVSGPIPAPPLREVVRAQALVVHGVSCVSGLQAMERCARHLNVGVCTVHVVQWLLGWQRHLVKRMSSIVVYLDRPVTVTQKCVRFGGALCPVERYVRG